jgi:hypothetical protein
MDDDGAGDSKVATSGIPISASVRLYLLVLSQYQKTFSYKKVREKHKAKRSKVGKPPQAE